MTTPPSRTHLPPVTPRVSIVAPALNAERYLAEMIASVRAQSYPNLDLFVQDGGSTDDTLALLRDSGVHHASARDSGTSQALNRATAMADGEVIGFMCTDDQMLNDSVQRAMDVFARHPDAVMVYGDAYVLAPDGTPIKHWRSRPFDVGDLFWQCYIPYQTVFVRRAALEAVGGFDERVRIVNDWDLWLRLGLRFRADQFHYVPHVMGAYREVADSMGLRSIHQNLRDVHHIARAVLHDPKVDQLPRGRAHARAGVWVTLAMLHRHIHEGAAARRAVWRALRLYPRMVLTRIGLGALILVFAGERPRRAIHLLRRRRLAANETGR